MRHVFTAAWLPYETSRDFDTAAVLAIEWAESQAASRGLPAVLVTDQKGEYFGNSLFDGYRNGRHASTKSPRINVHPGAVIAHVPTPEALDLAMRRANGNALVVVEHPSPWRLSGWAGVVRASDIVTGDIATIDPRLSEHLDHLVLYGNNGYARGFGRDGADHVLRDMHANGLLDRDVVPSALGAFGISPRAQRVVAELIDRILPVETARY